MTFKPQVIRPLITGGLPDISVPIEADETIRGTMSVSVHRNDETGDTLVLGFSAPNQRHDDLSTIIVPMSAVRAAMAAAGLSSP